MNLTSLAKIYSLWKIISRFLQQRLSFLLCMIYLYVQLLVEWCYNGWLPVGFVAPYRTKFDISKIKFDLHKVFNIPTDNPPTTTTIRTTIRDHGTKHPKQLGKE
jgi:hypothetical protein